jgi:hypothetical protein
MPKFVNIVLIVNSIITWFKHILFPEKVEIGLDEQSAIEVLS